jgi:hypothetical protein
MTLFMVMRPRQSAADNYVSFRWSPSKFFLNFHPVIEK